MAAPSYGGPEPTCHVTHVVFYATFGCICCMKRKATNGVMVSLRTANKSEMLRSDSDAVFHDQCIDAEIFRLRYSHV